MSQSEAQTSVAKEKGNANQLCSLYTVVNSNMYRIYLTLFSIFFTVSTYQCPADFMSFSYDSSANALWDGDEQKELWLIKAPANFNPKRYKINWK